MAVVSKFDLELENGRRYYAGRHEHPSKIFPLKGQMFFAAQVYDYTQDKDVDVIEKVKIELKTQTDPGYTGLKDLSNTLKTGNAGELMLPNRTDITMDIGRVNLNVHLPFARFLSNLLNTMKVATENARSLQQDINKTVSEAETYYTVYNGTQTTMQVSVWNRCPLQVSKEISKLEAEK